MIGYVWVRANTLISNQFKEGESFPINKSTVIYKSQGNALKVRSESIYKHIWFLWEIEIFEGEMEPQERVYRLYPGKSAEWTPTRMDLLFDFDD